MANLFNEQMSSIEARFVLFTHTEGKTKEEKEEIFKQYKAVLPIIIERETYDGSNLIIL